MGEPNSCEPNSGESNSGESSRCEPKSGEERGVQFPVASVRSTSSTIFERLRRYPTRMWYVAAICAVISLVLVIASVARRGDRIQVSFEHGYGIKPGDSLQYRGIEAGRVESVVLRPAGDGVVVAIRLERSAVDLARTGSQFWIERPRFSLARVSGLETVVGAKYLGVQPGPPGGSRQTKFVGLESPLTLLDSSAQEVQVHFLDGNGLTVGDVARYRGLVVGEVTSVELDESLAGIHVQVRLAGHARELAREGTQFWVERPRIDTSAVRGLETLTSGRYLAVSPGPSTAPRADRFEGLDLPPPQEIVPGSLEIVLVGSTRGALYRGVPVTFRGLPIGHIISVGLARDAGSIESRAVIEPAYVGLVREHTVFWDDSGIDFSLGLTGFKFDAGNLASVVVGSVAMATPNPPGKPATTGHRFTVHVTPEEKEKRTDWLSWQPQINVGHDQLPGNTPLPQPLRASLRWTYRKLGIKRSGQRSGWILPLDDGRLVGPKDLFGDVNDAIDGRLLLELGGRQIEIQADEVTTLGNIAFLKNGADALKDVPRWPVSRMRRPTQVEDSLFVTSSRDKDLLISANRLTAKDQTWLVTGVASLVQDHHGGCLVALADGNLIGILVFTDQRPAIAFLTTGEM